MPFSTRILAAIDQLAQQQGGHVARWQLLGLGCSAAQLDHFPARLGWILVHPGVWRLPGASPTPQGTMWAAILTGVGLAQRGPLTDLPAPLDWSEVHGRVHGSIAVAGVSAAWLLGLTDNPPTIPQLLVPHHLKCRIRGLRIIRTRVWPEGVRSEDGRLPTTPPVRTLWDSAWVMRRERDATSRIRRMMSRADGLRLCKAEDLHLFAREPRSYGLPGVVPEPFRAAAFSLAGSHSHSAAEHKARQIVTEIATTLGLHVEPRPYEVKGDQGRVGEADIAIPLIRFDCEIDGPHHDEADQKRKDRWRDGKMRRMGWTVRRYPDWMVHEDEEGFREAVEADIRQAAAAAGVILRAA